MSAGVRLAAGRERSLLRRHPWIFAGAIAEVTGTPDSGDTVDVHLADGLPIARGAYSPHSQIGVRVWSFDLQQAVDDAFFLKRVADSLQRREPFCDHRPGSALRLVNAESDGLPGLVVDRYGDYVICQFLSCGAERWRHAVIDALVRLTGCAGIYERSDASVRHKEGLPLRTGVLAGRCPPARIEIREGPCRFQVDVMQGHKTGFYLDQREGRAAVHRLAAGREVLNAFAYTGSMSVHALRGGAKRVTQIESSAEALEMAAANLALNRLGTADVESLQGDAFIWLRRLRDAGRKFDMVILDPPKFAESRGHVMAASRGYKDINLLGIKLLRPGGLLVTFSCSGHIGADLFQKIVADAALDAGRDARLLQRLGQPPDHPTALAFPEGTYLKGLVCHVP